MTLFWIFVFQAALAGLSAALMVVAMNPVTVGFAVFSFLLAVRSACERTSA